MVVFGNNAANSYRSTLAVIMNSHRFDSGAEAIRMGSFGHVHCNAGGAPSEKRMAAGDRLMTLLGHSGVSTPPVQRALEEKIDGFAGRLLRQIDESPLRMSQKFDLVEGLLEGEIIPGRLAIERKLVPETVAAGSLDPCTRGHAFMAQAAQAIDPDAGMVIVQSTSKPPEYQLFPLIVRAGLLRAYGVRMRILLGEGDEHMSHMEVLSALHRIPKTIVKGRRGAEDEAHTLGLAAKYGIDPAKFTQIEPPAELMAVSSGDVKGLIALGQEDQIRAHIADSVRAVVSVAVNRSTPAQTEMFVRRHQAGSSEAMFKGSANPSHLEKVPTAVIEFLPDHSAVISDRPSAVESESKKPLLSTAPEGWTEAQPDADVIEKTELQA